MPAPIAQPSEGINQDVMPLAAREGSHAEKLQPILTRAPCEGGGRDTGLDEPDSIGRDTVTLHRGGGGSTGDDDKGGGTNRATFVCFEDAHGRWIETGGGCEREVHEGDELQA